MVNMLRVTERWEREMYDKLRVKDQRIFDLEAENAALWAFVKAEDAFNGLANSADWDADDAAYHAMLAAREALRQYENGGDR